MRGDCPVVTVVPFRIRIYVRVECCELVDECDYDHGALHKHQRVGTQLCGHRRLDGYLSPGYTYTDRLEITDFFGQQVWIDGYLPSWSTVSKA